MSAHSLDQLVCTQMNTKDSDQRGILCSVKRTAFRFFSLLFISGYRELYLTLKTCYKTGSRTNHDVAIPTSLARVPYFFATTHYCHAIP